MSETRQTILYIEDDPASRRLVERTLLFAGYHVLMAENGLDGIDLARKHAPDLVLTDINLPDLTGHEIATALRYDERLSRTPIVALTAQGHGGKEWEMAFAAGVNGYITKPINVETLAAQVEYYLGGGQDKIDTDRLASARQTYTHEIVNRLESRIRELETVNRELLEIDKVKDTFIELTAHELRTPLTLVYGYSRLLEEHPTFRLALHSEPDLATLVEGMAEAIERMQVTVEEIVTVSRILTDQVELNVGPVNLGKQVQRALNALAIGLQQRTLTIHFDAAQWPTIRGDSDLLYISLFNLISNAVKFTPDGGEIFLVARRDNDRVRFSIRDTGVGIDPAEQRRIFERFHTTNDVRLHSTSKTAFAGGGLGLGLSICKGIIEAHGGQLWVESTGRDPQKMPGSEFVVSLPVIPTKSNDE